MVDPAATMAAIIHATVSTVTLEPIAKHALLFSPTPLVTLALELL
jgi:hypothetical protein